MRGALCERVRREREEWQMAGMLFVVWGVALLVLLGLGAVLIWTLRGGTRPAERELGARESWAPMTDTLLLYHEEQSVRRTPHGDVVLYIPGNAWEPEWHEDLVRLEVTRMDPRTVPAPESWGEVLAAYDLHAHRMTEIGTDIQVEAMAAPVAVFLTTESEMEGLRFGVNDDGMWTLAPPAAVPVEVLEQAGIPATCGWAAALIARFRQVCLVRMPLDQDS